MQRLQTQLSSIERKMQQLAEMIQNLRAENAKLSSENERLNNQLAVLSNANPEAHTPAEFEQFSVQVMQAKKIKREVEQMLRDAERKLEALRF